MEQELFGQVLNDDDLQDELEALDAEIAGVEIPSAPDGLVEQSTGQKAGAQKEKAPEKRQLVAA